ncbi:MAG TPA: RluA family pseudouridine synthase [Patescibacteria group bacterium]|nr:RluA family pseudouridine synthase [Patescibacteria group bacterium]
MKDEKNIIIIDSESAGERLDLFLAERLGITRSQIQKLITNNGVTVNKEAPRKSGQKLVIGDQIQIQTNDSTTDKTLITEAPVYPTFTFKDIKILEETPTYLIIEKPWGMLTHSTERREKDSLAELLVQKYPELTKIGEDLLRPGIVHRLDKEASGLLVIPRTEATFDHLKNLFKTRQIDKEYLVLVHGQVEKDWNEIKFPLTRSKTSERIAAIPQTMRGRATEEGKKAETEFWVEKRFVNFTLLKVKIHTGRMHQIRAHFLAYNHPVVGDPLYFQKKNKQVWDKKLGRLFLHCHELSFVDLEGDKKSYLSSLPKELEVFLKALK